MILLRYAGMPVCCILCKSGNSQQSLGANSHISAGNWLVVSVEEALIGAEAAATKEK